MGEGGQRSQRDYSKREEVTLIADHLLAQRFREKTTGRAQNTIDGPTTEWFFKYHIHVCIRNIFNHSESPIEQILLSTLLLASIPHGVNALVFTTPLASAGVDSARVSARMGEFKQRCELLKSSKNVDLLTVHSYSTMFDYLKVLYNTKDAWYREIGLTSPQLFLYDVFDMSIIPHVSPQTGIDKVPILRGNVRVDAYIWFPADPSIKIVVECDGFKYHANRASYTADRERDRGLKAAGYDVLRFSGSEINQDPLRCGVQLWVILMQKIAGLHKAKQDGT